MDCHIVSLNIHGAFDSAWSKGLLQHLQSVGMRGKAYNLMCSYLSDRTLFVVAHSDTSSKRPYTAGVPQGGIWSPILFNLYIRHISAQIFFIVICLLMLMIQLSSKWYLQRMIGLLQLLRSMLNWIELIYGGRSGIFILHWINVIHFVCHLKRM